MTALGEVGPIVVVGAGPAGSLLAIYLAHQGHDVVVYESRPDMRRVDIAAGRSINLALAARGITALAEVGVMDRVDPITIAMRGRMVHTAGDAELQPYGTSPDEVIHSVSRTDLNAILLDAAEATGRVRFEFEQRCRAVDLTERVLTFTDDRRPGRQHAVEFGSVFGADGSGSVVRGATVAASGGVVDIAELGHGYKELTIPAGPDGRHQLDPHALHIWPRRDFMLIALANPPGDFTATLFLAHEGSDESFASLTGPEAVRQFFAREFADFVPLVPDLAADFFDGPTGRLATIRCSGWSHEDASVLVGDAAHAIVPFHGQGMNAAMESCRILDRCLREFPADLAEAFRAFEAERKQDVDAIADMALENYVEMRSDVVDPDYVLGRQLELALERRWPDRVRPRYSMVMFDTVPYAEARRRARLQDEVIDQLIAGHRSVDAVDLDLADALTAALPPLPEGVR